ncbi:hypothetical protein D3C76_1554030 [compost metagenome]
MPTAAERTHSFSMKGSYSISFCSSSPCFIRFSSSSASSWMTLARMVFNVGMLMGLDT